MPSLREAMAFHRGVDTDGRQLTAAERQELLRPYLPTPPLDRSPSRSPNRYTTASKGKEPSNTPTASKACRPRRHRRRRLRQYLAILVYQFVYFLIQSIFSLYIHLRQFYHAILGRFLSLLYYHHRTPELIHRDIKTLGRLPKHLSVIVDLKDDERGGEAESLSRLIEDVAEIAAWCACAGIPVLSVYERSGILKSHILSLHRCLSSTFRSYFPPDSTPTLQIRAPHHTVYTSPDSDVSKIQSTTSGTSPEPLQLLLLSASDGRATLVDLTKTLAEMAQRGKLAPSDITAELIDAEISATVCTDPDLLVLMARAGYDAGAPRRGRTRKKEEKSLGVVGGEAQHAEREAFGAGADLCLRGYPPWQVRLTEIFHVKDNEGVGYQVFLRALHRYAKAEMRLGR